MYFTVSDRKDCKDMSAWRVVSASVTGSNHIGSQRGCEDALYPIYESDVAEDILVYAVADGLGSASHAAQGAQCAVLKAVMAMRDRLTTMTIPLESDVVNAVFHDVHQALVQLADQLNVSVNDVACTLQLVVMNAQQLLMGQVGDGLVLGIRTNCADAEPVVQLSTMRSKDYGNLTHTMIAHDFVKHLQVTDIRQEEYNQYDGVVLMTDGAQSLCFEYQIMKPFQPFFVELIAWLNQNQTTSVTELNQQLVGFFSSEELRQKSSDDITFVVARRTAS